MHSASQASHLANAQNAQHSTGPRTPEGKARAAANARTHGLCAKDVLIANPEEQTEFDELLGLHLAELKPHGSIEQVIFDTMLADTWNLRRIRRLETALQQGIDPLEAINDEPLQKKLERIARHRTRIENSYFKALKELSRIQSLRVLNKCNEESVDLAEISPLLNLAEFRRRSAKSDDFKTNPNFPSPGPNRAAAHANQR